MEKAMEKRNQEMRVKMAKKLAHVQAVLDEKAALLEKKKGAAPPPARAQGEFASRSPSGGPQAKAAGIETGTKECKGRESLQCCARLLSMIGAQTERRLSLRGTRCSRKRLLRGTSCLVLVHTRFRQRSPIVARESAKQTQRATLNGKNTVRAKSLGRRSTASLRLPRANSTAKFSTAQVPSEIDWCIRRAKALPAPADYQSKISAGLQPATSAFSMGNCSPKTDVDWIMIKCIRARSRETISPAFRPQRWGCKSLRRRWGSRRQNNNNNNNKTQ